MDFLKLLKPKATHSKNGFDLSRKHVFSSKAGQLRPCLCVETVPDDTFEIDVTALTRSMTMNTAAFLRGKMRYDFFFVPYSQLWHPFNQFISQRTDKHSVNQKNHLHCPVINLKDLLYFLIDMVDGNAVLYELDVHGYDSVYQMVDNLNLLGYGDFRFVYSNETTASRQSKALSYNGKYVNIFRLAAFQHIWYDFYRNKYYDVDNTGGIQTDYSANLFSDIDMFNFDDLDCSSLANSVLPIGNNSQVSDPTLYRLMRLLQPRYVQYKKDLFTSRLPGQQFGAVSSVNFNAIGSSNREVVVGNTIQSGNIDGFRKALDNKLVAVQNGVDANVLTNSNLTISSSFDVLSLRKAEMLQVWKQRTLRAGNMVDDSFEAHYGVKPYYEDENNVNYLGSFSSALQVNTVEATANAGQSLNGKVGDIAATGTCVIKGNKIRFSPKDFGVIMCCSSFLPESEYNSDGIDKANTLCEQFDFFTPEFENIGLEAIPLREFTFNPTYASSSEKVIGYAPRYWMYKEARDKVFGQFMNFHPLGVPNSLTAWVSPRTIQPYLNGGIYYVMPSDLYVNPNIFNNIFGIVADEKADTDIFLNNIYFDIKAVRPMSELGLPQF